MVQVEIVPATQEHAEAIARTVRPEDKAELWATVMGEPLAVMEKGIKISDQALTGLVDGEPVCMWGVVLEDLILNSGTPWMVCSSKIEKHEKLFLRRTRAGVRAVLEKYDILQNYVDARNGRAIKWLRWLGFTIEATEPYGMLGLPFHRFTMMKGG